MENLLRNIDPTIWADRLGDQVHGKQGSQILRSRWIFIRGEKRVLYREIDIQVVPLSGDLIFIQEHFDRHNLPPLMCVSCPAAVFEHRVLRNCPGPS